MQTTLSHLSSRFTTDEKQAIFATLWANTGNVHAPVDNLNQAQITAGQKLFNQLNTQSYLSDVEREIAIALSSLADYMGADLDPYDFAVAEELMDAFSQMVDRYSVPSYCHECASYLCECEAS